MIRRILLILTVVLLVGCAQATTENEPNALSVDATLIPPTATATLSAGELTLIAGATNTAAAFEADPDLPTATPIQAEVFSVECEPGRTSTIDSRASSRLQGLIDEAEIKDAVISVLRTEETDCETTDFLNVSFNVSIMVGDLEDNEMIGTIAAGIIEILGRQANDLARQFDEALVNLQFTSSNDGEERAFLGLPYSDVLSAYNSGARGETLVAQLNRITPLE